MTTHCAQYTALVQQLGTTRVRRNQPLAPFTTFKIGGPADLFYEATTVNDLVGAVLAARSNDVPYFVLGMGANVLIGDKGFRGLVIRNLTRKIRVYRKSCKVYAESGVLIFPDLIECCLRHGLSGLEHFAGIPSTVGGALRQNLHFLSPPPDRERTVYIEEVVHDVELLTEAGVRITVDPGYLEFGYDDSILHRKNDVVLGATFALTPSPQEEIQEVIEANLAWRREHHPPLETQPSAGSVFKKIQGIGAGRLIEACGLKGMRVGDAEISPLHANIIVNRGHATAKDVKALIALVQEVVERDTGYHLEPEIGFIGEF